MHLKARSAGHGPVDDHQPCHDGNANILGRSASMSTLEIRVYCDRASGALRLREEAVDSEQRDELGLHMPHGPAHTFIALAAIDRDLSYPVGLRDLGRGVPEGS